MSAFRETLAKGGLAALPAVQAMLGDERLTVTRTPDGRWEIRGKSSFARVYADREARWSQALSVLVH